MEKYSAYFSANGLPTTLNSVVAYLDVLGFREEMQRAHQTGASDVFLRKFADIVNKWVLSMRDTPTPGFQARGELKVFTDNVVIGYPIKWDGEGELGLVMSEIGWLQFALALEGFFIRGGIAIGEFYMDDDIVYGVGLVDAYAVEQAADVPRVVLSDSAVGFLKRHLTSYISVDSSPQNSAVVVDEDGKLFINYLDSVWAAGHTEAPYDEWLSQHRDIVTEKLDLHRKQPRVWSKYAWSARYHNYFCEILPGGKQHKIDATLLNLRAQRLADVYSVPSIRKRLNLSR